MASFGLFLGYLGLVITIIAGIAPGLHLASHLDPAQQLINCLNHQLNDPSVVCPGG